MNLKVMVTLKMLNWNVEVLKKGIVVKCFTSKRDMTFGALWRTNDNPAKIVHKHVEACYQIAPSVAQWLARLTLNQWVRGSSLRQGNIKCGQHTCHFSAPIWSFDSWSDILRCLHLLNASLFFLVFFLVILFVCLFVCFVFFY